MRLQTIRYLRIVCPMQATFVELPPFEKYRAGYLSDDEYRLLQEEMLRNPEAGDVIKGTGGLRKLLWR